MLLNATKKKGAPRFITTKGGKISKVISVEKSEKKLSPVL
jgi:hypothetical protein